MFFPGLFVQLNQVRYEYFPMSLEMPAETIPLYIAVCCSKNETTRKLQDEIHKFFVHLQFVRVSFNANKR